jgi:hypothetical protein
VQEQDNDVMRWRILENSIVLMGSMALANHVGGRRIASCKKANRLREPLLRPNQRSRPWGSRVAQ